jgi:thioesterase domain-containing protein
VSFSAAAILEAEDAADELDLLDFACPSPAKKAKTRHAEEEQVVRLFPCPVPERTDDPQAELQEQILTVQQKLAKAQQEAEEARKRDPKKPEKRTAIPRRVRSRRRSTLSPEELEELLRGGGV